MLAGSEVGAKVTIMARTQSKLDEAVREARKQTSSKEIHSISVNLSDIDATHAAFANAQNAHGPVYGVFCCAGAARPQLFEKQDAKRLDFELNADYLTALNSAHVPFYWGGKGK